MVPMHFGTFNLGREPIDEPLQRLLVEAARLGITGKVKVLEEGETMRISSHVNGQRAQALTPQQQSI